MAAALGQQLVLLNRLDDEDEGIDEGAQPAGVQSQHLKFARKCILIAFRFWF
jgi:hypothetical protein